MTQRAFIIGHPVAHSRSPLMHAYWLKQYGVDGSFEAIDVAPADLQAFVTRLRTGEFVGGNATLPHKEHLLTLCDAVDDKARRIGAVNTLVCRNGEVLGSNTDWIGFLGNLDERAPGWDSKDGTALVLGAGGAARAIIIALIERGFETIHILNRTPHKAEQLAQEFTEEFTEEFSGPSKTQLSGHPLSDFADLASDAAVLVNTSSVGMHGSRFEGLALANLPQTALVTDIVYTPIITPLLADARHLGLAIADGLGMLMHQGVPGFAAWFGVTPQVTPQLRALLEESFASQ